MRPLRRITLAVAAVAALGIAGTATASTASSGSSGLVKIVKPRTAFNASQSSNWFGYQQSILKTKKPFTEVSAVWTVPTASQHTRGQAENSSQWIGIGGGCLSNNCLATDNTLIQAGTEADVAADGSTSYSAWWEIIPAPSIRVNLAVRPGDVMYSDIKMSVVPGVWNLVLKNRTTGRQWKGTAPYASTFGTAEWITETPLLIGTNAGFATLPNLTPVHFDNATANGTNPHLTYDQRIELTDSNLNVIGIASKPQADGNGFNACAWAATCPTPANL